MTLFVQLFLVCKKIVAQCNHPHLWRKKSKNEKTTLSLSRAFSFWKKYFVLKKWWKNGAKVGNPIFISCEYMNEPKKGIKSTMGWNKFWSCILISMPLRFHKFNFTTIVVISILHKYILRCLVKTQVHKGKKGC